MNKVVVKHFVTPNQKSYLEGCYSGFEFAQDAEGGQWFTTKHPHLVGHYTRQAAELVALRLLRRLGAFSVVDIGGNPSRAGPVAQANGMAYHSCNPVLEAKDQIRKKLQPILPHVGTTCSHKAQDCNCVSGVDAYLCVHSAYYLRPDEVAELVSRSKQTMLVSVQHTFPLRSRNQDLDGVLCDGEAKYTITGTEVEMHVDGNFQPYRHSSMPWLSLKSIHTPSGRLVWDIVTTIGDQHVILFSLLKGSLEELEGTVSNPVPVYELTPGLSARDVDLRGLRNNQDVIPHNEIPLKFPLAYATQSGFHFLPEDGPEIFVPEQLVSCGRLFMAGNRKRNYDNFSLLINHLKGQIGRLNVPHNNQSRAIIVAAALSMTTDLDLEVQTRMYIHGYLHEMAAVNDFVVAPQNPNLFEVVKVHVMFWIWWLIIVTTINPPVFVPPYDPRWTITQWCCGWMQTLAFYSVGPIHDIFARLECAPLFFHLTWTQWIWNLFYGLPIPVKLGFNFLLMLILTRLSAVGYFHSRRLLSRVYYEGAKPVAVSLIPNKFSSNPDFVANLKNQVGKIVSKPQEWWTKWSSKPGYVPAVLVDNVIPPRCSNDVPTQIHGLVVRMLSGVEHCPKWLDIADSIDSKELFGDKLEDQHVPDFYYWVRNVFGRRDDPARVAALIKAYEEVQADPSILKFTISPFIKDEAYVGKGVNPKPRVIFSPNDHYTACSGPVCSLLTKNLKEIWNQDHIIYYTSGANAKDLGNWYTKAMNDIADPVVIEDDFSQFESRVTVEARQFVVSIWKFLTGLDKELDIILLQNDQRGRTREGLSWGREGGMSSGVGDTSPTNSMINGVAHYVYFKNLCQKHGLDIKGHVRIAVLGDDNVAVISRQLFKLMMKETETLEGWLRSLGMLPELKYHESNFSRAEFCSGWFIKTHDAEGNWGHYWTPKLGRVISKTFFIKPTEANGRAVIKGIAQSYREVPVDPVLHDFSDALYGTIEGPWTPVKHSEYQPQLVELGLNVKPSVEGWCERYGLTEDEFKVVREYLITKTQTDVWPIRISTTECPLLTAIIEIDGAATPLEDTAGPISLNLAVDSPNLTSVDREPIPNPPHFSGPQQGPLSPNRLQRRRNQIRARGRPANRR